MRPSTFAAFEMLVQPRTARQGTLLKYQLSTLLELQQALSVVVSTTISRSNGQDSFINVITQPTTGTVIQPSQLFPFHYLPGSRCHLLYTPVKIWLLDHQPTLSDFDINGLLLGTSLNYWGEYVTINIAGEQNYTPTPTIPDNLTMPVLDESYLGANVYLTATQSENGACPVYVPDGFDASFVELQYGGQ